MVATTQRSKPRTRTGQECSSLDRREWCHRAISFSCSQGGWIAVSRLSFNYQWLRDGSAIEGATSSTYTVQAADEGHTLSCEVTASNTSGSQSATSAALAIPAPIIGGGSLGSGSSGAGSPGGGRSAP